MQSSHRKKKRRKNHGFQFSSHIQIQTGNYFSSLYFRSSYPRFHSFLTVGFRFLFVFPQNRGNDESINSDVFFIYYVWFIKLKKCWTFLDILDFRVNVGFFFCFDYFSVEDGIKCWLGILDFMGNSNSIVGSVRGIIVELN